MIRPRLAIFSMLALLVGTTGARAVDKKKLRRATSLPMIDFFVGYGVNRRGYFMTYPVEKTPPQPEKIAALVKELKDDETDVPRYNRLADLYFRGGESDKAEEARHKVVSLLRKQFEKHADDLTCRLRLANALEAVQELDEAETLARRAVKDHADDWHAWVTLGKILDSKCWQTITDDKPFQSSTPEALLQSLRAAQPTSQRIAAARRDRQEVVACFDRAVAIAPRVSKTYLMRGASRYHYDFLDLGLRFYKGEKAGKADFMECFLGRKAMPDLRKAVDLSCDEYMGIGMVAVMEAAAEAQDYQMRNPSAKQPEKMLDILSESTRKRVREDMARLEKGAQNPDKHKAAEAAEVLGSLQFLLLQDYSAAEKSARCSIELDPTREAAWDILAGCLISSENYRKAVVVFRQRLEHEGSARNRLLLAKAYTHLDQLYEAEAVVQIGLNHEPDNFLLRLAKADLLLMRGDAGSLNEARQILDKIDAEKIPDAANYAFTCGIYYGLTDASERAHEFLEKVQQHQPTYPRIKEALQALDEPGEATSPRPLP